MNTTVYDSKGKTTNQVHNTLAVTKSAQLGKDKYYLVSVYSVVPGLIVYDLFTFVLEVVVL
jgi:hypothetical protein